jgi:hypothetical protein
MDITAWLQRLGLERYEQAFLVASAILGAPAMSTLRLCKDCRWAALEENESGMVWRCTHRCSKFMPPPDYVTGKPVKTRQLSCYEARRFDDASNCGPQGRYWETR